MTWAEASQLLTALAAIASVLVSLRNGRRIEAVHRSTNGLSERNEQIARKLGVAEGKADEKANPT